MIWLLGDVHGNFDHVLETVERTGEQLAVLVFLGDLECQRPFSECVAEIEAAGIQCWAIPGNHDTDSIDNYLNLWGDDLFQERNLHGRVVEIAGLRVSGLGGIFRGQISEPRAAAGGRLERSHAFSDGDAGLRHQPRVGIDQEKWRPPWREQIGQIVDDQERR